MNEWKNYLLITDKQNPLFFVEISEYIFHITVIHKGKKKGKVVPVLN
jgi:hypothetical protein